MKLRFLGDLAKLKKCLLRTGVAGQWRELPTLDIEASLAIVEATHGFVDLYKVGRVNYLPMTKTTDWRDYTLRVLDTLNRVNARHYIRWMIALKPFWQTFWHSKVRSWTRYARECVLLLATSKRSSGHGKTIDA